MLVQKESVKVFSPATLANIGSGYDVLGLAIHGVGDEISIKSVPQGAGVEIVEISGDEGRLPWEATKNTAAIAAEAVLTQVGVGGGFAMKIAKKMPFGSGLGSSAASAVGGAYAMNAILGSPLSKLELIDAAMQGEALASQAWHADNVAPAMLGGICLVRDHDPIDILSLPIPTELWITVIYNPKVEILTSEARHRVPQSVPTSLATQQAGHLGALVKALYEEDFDLIQRATQDRIAEPHRKSLIPNYERYQEQAFAAGAKAFGISGSGPSLFALCKGEPDARRVARDYAKGDIITYTSQVNKDGAVFL